MFLIKLLLVVISAVVVMSAIGCDGNTQRSSEATTTQDGASGPVSQRFIEQGVVVNWWDPVPERLRATGLGSESASNIHPADYIGPDGCQKCHPKNHAGWFDHPHRSMNALATAETVKGDFSGRSISYLGGEATFFKAGEEFRMRLNRSGIEREYSVTQTIGSRFFQYFAGRVLQGPEADDYKARYVDHVLPFGYWIDREEWVPIVHVESRADPGPPRELDPFARTVPMTAYYQCNSCHTTFPLGDSYLRRFWMQQDHQPAFRIHFDATEYLARAHPDVWNDRPVEELPETRMRRIAQRVWEFEAPEQAVTLGISCEACHLGGRQHAENPRNHRPDFVPASPHRLVKYCGAESDFDNPHTAPGRSVASLNWTCGRCHSGLRPQLAAGMSTWNSTEYSDALRGSCYSQLKCIDCHNPHQAIGKTWSPSPAADDASCLKCHSEFEPAESRFAHTHHPAGSKGSRCMNCHMPYLNEGLQDVVRTHMISSPTNHAMIQANQPNACNQCHADQPLKWTIGFLKDWYAKEFPDLPAAAVESAEPASINWLNSDNHSVRILAVDCLTRTKSTWALPQLLESLDDPMLLNRQFARIGLERMLNIRLADFGYQFYMSAAQRKEPLARLKDAILTKSGR